MKTNLRLIFYDYGVDCNIQTKDFNCKLKRKATICLLYRKCHYDLCYTSEFYNRYKKYLDKYISSNSLKIVDSNLLLYFENNMEDVDLFQSKIFTKVNGEILKFKKEDNKETNTVNNLENIEVKENIGNKQNIEVKENIGNKENIRESMKVELENELNKLKEKLNSLEKKCMLCTNCTIL